MDFDAPLDEVWRGYRMPEELQALPCPTCAPHSPTYAYGDGLTPEARAIDRTFYATQISYSWDDQLEHARTRAWGDKLGQAEVDNLWAEGRLNQYLRAPEDQRCGAPCDDAPEGAVWVGRPCGRFKDHDGAHHPRAGEWVKPARPPRAADVNALNHTPGPDSHDAINRWILVKFRCKVLGIEQYCQTCEGEGEVYRNAEHRQAHEAWERTDPPTGPGWQLWTTTTEGSPITPVFARAAELAAHCAEHCTAFASIRWTAEQWLASFQAGTTDVDTLLVVRVR